MNYFLRGRLGPRAWALGLLFPAMMSAGLTTWRLESANAVAGHDWETWGEPLPVETEIGRALSFDGVADGIVVAKNPIAGWSRFTIEVLFRPAAGGPRAQRFLHLGERNGDRVLVELRMNDDGQWFLDTFIRSGDDRRALADSSALHPAGEWYWAALTYDGVRMMHFVNGREEAFGEVEFTPLSAGRTSLGVRMTAESWFKGALREVRFHDRVVPNAELKIPDEPQRDSARAADSADARS